MKRLFLFSLILLALPSALHAQFVDDPENLQDLVARRSQFSAGHPLSSGVQTQPEFTRELIQVMWRNGDPIDLYVVKPVNAVKPPVVIFLYSWPEDTDRYRSDEWCRAVTSHGFAAVGFVSALTGQRYHDRPWKENFLTEMPEALVKTAHDVQLALDYLATRPDVDTTHAAIFGQGSGGTIAILAASVDSRFKAIDVIDPWGDWPNWFPDSPVIAEERRAQLVAPSFLHQVAPFDPVKVLPSLKGRTLRLQQSSINPSTPRTAKASIRKALPEGAIFTEYTSEADYRARAMDHSAILDWLQAQVGPTSPAQ